MKLIALMALLALGACSTPSHREPAAAATESQPFMTGKEDMPPVELGEHWGPENDKQTDEIVNAFIGMLTSETKPGMTMHRDAHPKHHACVKAQFEIDGSLLPPDERVGLYATKNMYDAWIRFSNAHPSGDAKPDSDLDQRGMAVKILGVRGSPTGNMDLVMMDDERFFSKNGENYVPMTKALMGGKLAIAAFAATHLEQMTALVTTQHHAISPLQSQYFSSTAYKLGSHSSRFTMKPCDSNNVFASLPNSKTASKNYLRERLVSVVTKQDSCFDFYVEPNNDPDSNDVENPLQVWDKSVSPYVKVGRIVIPVQPDPTSASQMNFCENVSMDPWRTPSENRPLGQINRIRKLAYPRISGFRHQSNARQRVEPTSLHPCDDAPTADLCQSSRK